MDLTPNLTPFFHLFDRWIDYIYQIDALSSFIIVIIALLIGFYSYKIYGFTKKRNYLLFSLAFLFIALGYAIKTWFDLFIKVESYHQEIVLGAFGLPLVYELTLLSFMCLILIGYIILIVITMKGNRMTALLFFLMVAVALLLSSNYYLAFSFITIILLSFLVYHFFMNFSANRKLNSGIVWFGFFLILLSQIIEIFMYFSNKFYLLSNLMLMAGFGMLLVNFIMVQRK